MHVNGYFELSSNRRDIWRGDDLAGEGRTRAEWNKALLEGIVAATYARYAVYLLYWHKSTNSDAKGGTGCLCASPSR